jgi:hypothetical protein
MKRECSCHEILKRKSEDFCPRPPTPIKLLDGRRSKGYAGFNLIDRYMNGIGYNFEVVDSVKSIFINKMCFQWMVRTESDRGRHVRLYV